MAERENGRPESPAQRVILCLARPISRLAGIFAAKPIEPVAGGIPVHIVSFGAAGAAPTVGLTVTLPSVTVSSLPNVTVATMPALVAESAKGVQKLASAALANPGPTTVFTAGASAKYRNVLIVICPNEGIAVDVTLWHGTAADANVLWWGQIAANAGPVVLSGLGINPSDTIIGSVRTGTTLKTTVSVYGELHG